MITTRTKKEASSEATTRQNAADASKKRKRAPTAEERRFREIQQTSPLVISTYYPFLVQSTRFCSVRMTDRMASLNGKPLVNPRNKTYQFAACLYRQALDFCLLLLLSMPRVSESMIRFRKVSLL
jgi:hypothetical protein